MADIYNFQRFGSPYMQMYPSPYQNYQIFQNPQFYPQTQLMAPNFNFAQSPQNPLLQTPSEENKVVIDLETTQNHSVCGVSESSEKHQNIFSQNDLKIREQVENQVTLKTQSQKEESLEQKLEHDSLEKFSALDIFNSSVLNPKCHFCPSTLLTAESSSKWVQCVNCLELFHESCQIVKRNQSENQPICQECHRNIQIQEAKSVLKVTKKIKKAPKKPKTMKLKVFKERTQSSIYLDSFLNGFGYRLAISEIQIQKQIDSLRRQRPQN